MCGARKICSRRAPHPRSDRGRGRLRRARNVTPSFLQGGWHQSLRLAQFVSRAGGLVYDATELNRGSDAFADLVYEQMNSLPEPLAREVLDFIGYLRERSERAEWRDLMNAQAPALATVWDNAEDQVWNDV